MNRLITLVAACMLLVVPFAVNAQKGVSGHFHEVIVSPYIQATFVQGDQESVTITSSIVDNSKLHIEVSHGELWLYLDGAREIPHNQHDYGYDGKHSYSLYPKHAVLVTVTYKKLDRLSLRGE